MMRPSRVVLGSSVVTRDSSSVLLGRRKESFHHQEMINRYIYPDLNVIYDVFMYPADLGPPQLYTTFNIPIKNQLKSKQQ